MKKPRRRRAYLRPQAGEWVQPVRRGYRMACCDCGLVHRMDFRVVKRDRTGARIVQFRVFRAERSTAAIRRRPHPFVRRDA